MIEDNEEAIRLFLENTDRLNKNERLKAVLKAEIFRLEKQNKLKRLTDPESNIMSFDDTDIPYVYEQDKKVERSMHRFNHPDEIIIDLHRVLYCSKESVFSSIINTVIFGKEDSLTLSSTMKLSKKQRKFVFDVAKTNFLVDNVHLTEDEARYILMQCRFETNDDLRSISRRNENEFRNTLPQMLGITKTALVVMKENSLLLNGKKKKMRDKVKAEYDPRVLNASMNPETIVAMVQNAAKYAEKNKNTENGIRMLFYGLSGTGKTELARYIAGQLGKEIILRRPSDILSKWVGEDEQNIRDAFEEAERSDAILLFDKADTFFYNRN